MTRCRFERGSREKAQVDVEALPRSPALRKLARADQLRCAIAGGDDYELCFTAPRAAAARVAAIAAETRVALTRIGTITAARGLAVRDERGAALPSLPRAFDHFA